MPYWYDRSRKKYHVKEIYLFGSYARSEADAQSDLDFLILGGDGFRLTEILFSLMRHRHHLIVSSFIRDLVLDQLELEEDGELEEARILKALELSYKEVYDLEEML